MAWEQMQRAAVDNVAFSLPLRKRVWLFAAGGVGAGDLKTNARLRLCAHLKARAECACAANSTSLGMHLQRPRLFRVGKKKISGIIN